MSEEKELGVVTHYFNHIQVGAVEIRNGELAVGDTIHIKGHSEDFTLRVESMQLEHESVQKATVGQNVGIKVPARVHPDDKVYKVG